jgi:lipoprotein
MRNAYLKIISICLALVFAVSCGSRKPAEPLIIENTKTLEKEVVVRDTIVLTPKDSVRTIVKIDCPEGGKPKIQTLVQGKKGKILQPPKLTLQGNQLTIDCKAEAEKLALKLYDKYVKEHETKTNVQYIEKPFKWYHSALMYFGGLSLLLFIIIGIAPLFIKSKI